MKKAYLFIGIGLATAANIVSSCKIGCVHGSGHSATETRKSGDFKQLHISGTFKVNIKQDSSLNVSITADDNLIKYIHTDIDGDELHIYTKKNLCNAGEMIINIGVRQLNELHASGAVEVNSDGKLNTGDFNMDLSGASKVNLDLNAANVVTGGSGSTEVNLKGQATSNKIDMSGEGRVHAFDFVVGSYDIETSGASQCEINVLKSLDIHTSGASDIKYKGNPSSVNTDKSGASILTKVD